MKTCGYLHNQEDLVGTVSVLSCETVQCSDHVVGHISDKQDEYIIDKLHTWW